MESNADKGGKNRLFLWVGLAFALQATAWGIFLWFAQKSKPDDVPLEHTRQVEP